MSVARKTAPQAVPDEPEAPSFAVEVRQEIGRVFLGRGDRTPLHAGLELAADYMAENLTSSEDRLVVQFTVPGMNTIRVLAGPPEA